MKSCTQIGILLAILGVIVLKHQGFGYTRQEKDIVVGPKDATRDGTQRTPLSPIVGELAFLGGAVMLVISAKQEA